MENDLQDLMAKVAAAKQAVADANERAAENNNRRSRLPKGSVERTKRWTDGKAMQKEIAELRRQFNVLDESLRLAMRLENEPNVAAFLEEYRSMCIRHGIFIDTQWDYSAPDLIVSNIGDGKDAEEKLVAMAAAGVQDGLIGKA